MSHFSVAVLVPSSSAADADAVQAAVSAMLAPFQENNMGDCPKQYMVFEDDEPEHLEQYEKEGSELVELESGERVYPRDDRFRVPGEIGIGVGTHKVPEHLKKVNVPHKERYATFEEFMADYCGYHERDPETGKYGSWDNPNKKWDWYTIGGRYSGRIPVALGAHANAKAFSGSGGLFNLANTDPRRADACELSAIDFHESKAQSEAKLADFWTEWTAFKVNGPSNNLFEGPRELAIDIGLLQCKNEDELTDAERADSCIKFKWSRQIKQGVDRYDVVTDGGLTFEEFSEKFLFAFSQISAYAALDSEGWHAPGRVGWFGFGSDTPDTLLAFKREFHDRLLRTRETDPSAWLVMVDCHI